MCVYVRACVHCACTCTHGVTRVAKNVSRLRPVNAQKCIRHAHLVAPEPRPEFHSDVFAKSSGKKKNSRRRRLFPLRSRRFHPTRGEKVFNCRDRPGKIADFKRAMIMTSPGERKRFAIRARLAKANSPRLRRRDDRKRATIESAR